MFMWTAPTLLGTGTSRQVEPWSSDTMTALVSASPDHVSSPSRMQQTVPMSQRPKTEGHDRLPDEDTARSSAANRVSGWPQLRPPSSDISACAPPRCPGCRLAERCTAARAARQGWGKGSGSARSAPRRRSAGPVRITAGYRCRVQFKVATARSWYRKVRRICTDTTIEIVRFNSAYSVARSLVAFATDAPGHLRTAPRLGLRRTQLRPGHPAGPPLPP